MTDRNLLKLLQLSDPALPIGGFSHSAGLETYVQQGIVYDKRTAAEFIATQLSQNIHYTDAAFVSLSYDAAAANDWQLLLELNNECDAVKLPREIREGSRKLGLRLLKIFQPCCDDQMLNEYLRSFNNGQSQVHYAISFGLASSVMQIPKDDALIGFYYNAAAGMITNCVKLVPLGQQDGQELLFSLHSLMENLALRSLSPQRELTGWCSPGFDIRSMQHEQLYSRLYMS